MSKTLKKYFVIEFVFDDLQDPKYLGFDRLGDTSFNLNDIVEFSTEKDAVIAAKAFVAHNSLPDPFTLRILPVEVTVGETNIRPIKSKSKLAA